MKTLRASCTMAVCEIVGGKLLIGEMHLNGLRNAALPILLRSMLGNGIFELDNVRSLIQGTEVMIRAMRSLGVRATIRGSRVTVDPSGMQMAVVLAYFALKIRSSLILIGILLACPGDVDLPIPGGCDFGGRKFDLHLTGLPTPGECIPARA